jgi:hypothetical protein
MTPQAAKAGLAISTGAISFGSVLDQVSDR